MYASILILTDNDEHDLPGCLQSVRWSDDVHVLDSFSSDRTVEIALKFGAQVTQRVSVERAAQLNVALDTIPFKHPWLLLLAPDERVTQGLETELKIMYYHLGSEVAYQVRKREVVWGRTLKRCREEAWPVRYFSWDSVRFQGSGQVVALVSGPVGRLEAAIDHHQLANGIDCWIAKANKLTTREAECLGLHAAYHKPARAVTALLFIALMNFIRRVVLQQAFRDGNAGVAYAFLHFFHECLVGMKRMEHRDAIVEKKAVQVPRADRLCIDY